ncbi:MAG: DNA-binding response regulator [Comamonadaceae bacterium CG2_30_57_122]|nr:MAG: DNA-binding response regulator [Comamonadaceae bacterium CG2_30_57_122]
MLADDHTLVRAGLHKLLDAIPSVEVVGEAGDGQTLLDLAAQHHPDVVLMDIAMPGLNGLEATARLLQDSPAVRVMILSMHQSEEYVRRALRLGAVAYLLKDAAPMELELALAAVMRGETYLSPAVSKGVVSDYVQRLRSDDQAGDPLSARQREVLQRIAQGLSTKEIARQLDLSVKTVETHRTSLMKLLDVHEVTGLVRYAIKTGLVSL